MGLRIRVPNIRVCMSDMLYESSVMCVEMARRRISLPCACYITNQNEID
jgi:hypothetical protein